MSEEFELLTANGVRFIILNLSRAILREAIILKSIIEEEINLGEKKLVLDISQCEFIDFSFVGSLVVEKKRMKEKGVEIMLIEPVKLYEDSFHVTYTLRIFEIYQTREEAIESRSEFKPSLDAINLVR
jgi:anti-sigma B factor antagonist/stage II sporulation protein AA (anti-sigma F factor antagonist)